VILGERESDSTRQLASLADRKKISRLPIGCGAIQAPEFRGSTLKMTVKGFRKGLPRKVACLNCNTGEILLILQEPSCCTFKSEPLGERADRLSRCQKTKSPKLRKRISKIPGKCLLFCERE
jgi:hypothetical protein